MVYHIVYFSTATKHFSEEDLTHLLVVSNRNNKGLGVTGILLFIEGCFLQVLEGEKEVVKEVFEKIKRDVRHDDVITLFKGKKEDRNFLNWSMGFKNLPFIEYKEQLGFEDISDDAFLNNVIKKADPKIIRTLEIFYNGGL